MRVIKNAFVILSILLYGYSQSVFSHLAILNSHHETQEVVVSHIHEDKSVHQHQEEHTEGCEDANCEVECTTIEEGKISLHNVNSYFLCSIKTHYIPENILYLTQNSNPSGIESHNTIHDIGPPISIERLMPRIGPIVRII